MTSNSQTPVAKYLSPQADTLINIYGYDVTVGPPEITAPEEFQASPSPMHHLADNSAAMIPNQSVDPIHYYAANLKETSDSPTKRINDQVAWVDPDGVTFELNLPDVAPVQLLMMHTGHSYVTLEVNGQIVWQKFVSPFFSNITIPAEQVKKGKNKLHFKASSFPYIDFGITSLHVGTVEVRLDYYWQTILNALVVPGNSLNKSVGVKEGNTSTTSETTSMSISLGASGTLKSIGLSLSASLSTSKSHSITISKETEITHEVQQSCPADCSSVTYQEWVLCLSFTTITRMVFDSGKKSLTVTPSGENQYFIARTFEEKKS